jgi:hypothetical protein
MNRKTQVAGRLASAAVVAAALALAPTSGAEARAIFTPLQATAATAPCSISALPVPDGWQGGVVDLNDSGVLVGSALDPDGHLHPTYWTPDGGGFLRHSPNLPAEGELLDVNNAGVAVGFDEDAGQGLC